MTLRRAGSSRQSSGVECPVDYSVDNLARLFYVGYTSINISNVTKIAANAVKQENSIKDIRTSIEKEMKMFLLLLENTKWWMTPVQREGQEDPGSQD